MFKNVIALLDNDFGSLRIVKNENSKIFINDIDLTNSGKNLLHSLNKDDCNLFLLVRETEIMDTQVYEQINAILSYNLEKPSLVNSIPYKDNLETVLTRIQDDFSISPGETIFVSSDRSSRHISLKKGYYAVPHPKVAAMVVQGKLVRFVRMLTDKSLIDQLPLDEVLPYYFEEVDNIYELLAIVSKAAIDEAIRLKIDVQILDVNLSYDDIVHINLTKVLNKDDIAKTTSNYGFLLLDSNRMIITVRERKIANIPIHGSHGHFIQLIPDDSLLLKFKTRDEINSQLSNSVFKNTMNAIRNWPINSIKFRSVDDIYTSFLEMKIEEVNSNSILDTIKRYSGEIELDSKGKINSRHCLHPDNARAVLALEAELKQMGYFVRVWEFQVDSRPPGVNPNPDIEGATFYNVIAELPGMGANLFLQNDFSSKIREIFLKYPNPLMDKPWIQEIRALVGDEWFEKNHLQSLPPLELKRKLEELFGLEVWTNWWIKEKAKPGLNSEIVIIGCHLDSTANLIRDKAGNLVLNEEYDPKSWKAPGADDDGSGLAGTIELARIFSKLKNKLTHTIQFCFFNAEEVGLRGSLEYAKHMRMNNAPVAAVLCMDMIGYNKDKSNRTFEIHSGHHSVRIRDNCLSLAKSVEESARSLGKLDKAQSYKGLSWGTGQPDEENRDKYDPAIQRSDHWSFQTHGYPAVLVSEDIFINIPTIESEKDSNPHYHQPTDRDTEIDHLFVGDIASSVALTAKKIAEL